MEKHKKEIKDKDSFQVTVRAQTSSDRAGLSVHKWPWRKSVQIYCPVSELLQVLWFDIQNYTYLSFDQDLSKNIPHRTGRDDPGPQSYMDFRGQ